MLYSFFTALTAFFNVVLTPAAGLAAGIFIILTRYSYSATGSVNFIRVIILPALMSIALISSVTMPLFSIIFGDLPYSMTILQNLVFAERPLIYTLVAIITFLTPIAIAGGAWIYYIAHSRQTKGGKHMLFFGVGYGVMSLGVAMSVSLPIILSELLATSY